MIDVRASVREVHPNKLARLFTNSDILWHGFTNSPDFICDTIGEFHKYNGQIRDGLLVKFPRLWYEMQDKSHLTLKDPSGNLDTVIRPWTLPEKRYLDQSGFMPGPDIIKERGQIYLVYFDPVGPTTTESGTEYFARNFPGMVPVLAQTHQQHYLRV